MGGGIMRAAAKAAVPSGRRPSIADHSRRAVRSFPVATNVSAAPPGGEAAAPTMPTLSSSSSSGVGAGVGQQRRTPGEMDEWEFAGGVEEELFDALHPTPTLVFGPIPTLDEAKEATSDLRDAISRVYFSPSFGEYGTSKLGMNCISSGPNSSLSSEAPMCASAGSTTLQPLASKHVMQAFSLLHESSQAQSVVASLACDKNIWDAVMKNEKVMEFYGSHKKNFVPKEATGCVSSVSGKSVTINKDEGDSLECILNYFTVKPLDRSDDNKLVQLMNTTKMKLSKMVTDISSLLHEFLSSSPDSTTDTSIANSCSNVNVGIGASFVALAVAAILVALLKRF